MCAGRTGSNSLRCNIIIRFSVLLLCGCACVVVVTLRDICFMHRSRCRESVYSASIRQPRRQSIPPAIYISNGNVNAFNPLCRLPSCRRSRALRERISQLIRCRRKGAEALLMQRARQCLPKRFTCRWGQAHNADTVWHLTHERTATTPSPPPPLSVQRSVNNAI